MYDSVLRGDLEVEDEEGPEESILRTNAAPCLAELPLKLMTLGLKECIDRGMEWGKESDVAE